MCLLCIEIAKKRMSVPEARRALGEMVVTATDADERKHYQELQQANDEKLEAAALEYEKKNPKW